jgi:GDP-4-dehydro-6-deoxy-D-mannose reductase
VKVLVTGADGFVGRAVVRRLVDDGRDVFAAIRPTAAPTKDDLPEALRAAVRWLPLELTDGESVRKCVDHPYDAVVHLAAVASGAEAQRDPGYAWTVNAAGTARLVDALSQARRDGRGDPRVLLVSTGEVYGRNDGTPRKETDPTAPCSSYAASKLGAEIAALEGWRRSGLRVVIARTFAHTGPGQDPRFVIPAFAQRLKFARKIGAPVVKVGNLEPVRELMHVNDAVDAYARLLVQGEAGAIYNVATGQGAKLEDLLFRMAAMLGVRPIVEADPELMRPADIPYLVGDPTRLKSTTGWAPRHRLDDILSQVLDATPE